MLLEIDDRYRRLAREMCSFYLAYGVFLSIVNIPFADFAFFTWISTGGKNT